MSGANCHDMLNTVRQISLFCFCGIFFLYPCKAEEDSLISPIPKNYKKQLILGETFAVGALHTGLYFAWYANYPQSSFHFIDDSREWLQMDKMGHAFSAYSLGVLGKEAGNLAGMNNKESRLNGILLGTCFQTLIEVFDGFSAQWGASVADIVANTSGSLLFYIQDKKWNEQRFRLKYSYVPTEFAAYRPQLLGNGIFQEFLKDYNGQSYWMSMPWDIILQHRSNRIFWKGLSLSFGYGANGMLGATQNIWTDSKTGILMDYSQIQRNRIWMCSLDFDWVRAFNPKKKGVRFALTALNLVKFPFPTLAYYSQDQHIQLHWLR